MSYNFTIATNCLPTCISIYQLRGALMRNTGADGARQSCSNDFCNYLSCIINTAQSSELITEYDQTTLLCTRDSNMTTSHGSPIFQMDADFPNNLWTWLAFMGKVCHTGRHTAITRYKAWYLWDHFDPFVFELTQYSSSENIKKPTKIWSPKFNIKCYFC